MKLTILETGRPPGALGEIYPGYPDMFAALLARAGEAVDCETVPVVDNARLPDPSAGGAFLITGSPAGVYDPLPWMDPLRGFIRAAHAARRPVVGVCFGHQIMAEALGGVVRKSPKGWGVGRHSYRIIERTGYLADAPETFALAASHQDQVIAPPPGATTLARSAHTEFAMLSYAGAPFLSLQGHPEFSDRFAAALYGARRGASLTDDVADAAIESLVQPDDSLMVAGWMLNVLREG
jgi:GMP synthase-like glutamine amidotransferase